MTQNISRSNISSEYSFRVEKQFTFDINLLLAIGIYRAYNAITNYRVCHIISEKA